VSTFAVLGFVAIVVGGLYLWGWLCERPTPEQKERIERARREWDR